MRVKMRTTAAGPEGVLLAGGVYDLPIEEAQPLLEGGYAIPDRGMPVETAVEKPLEAEEPEKAEEEPLPKWRLKTSPEEYLKKNPSGPKADLARRHLEADEK